MEGHLTAGEKTSVLYNLMGSNQSKFVNLFASTILSEIFRVIYGGPFVSNEPYFLYPCLILLRLHRVYLVGHGGGFFFRSLTISIDRH